MSAHHSPLRIAIGQLRMRWTCEENVAAILRTLSGPTNQGVDLCVFPELSVTGFHRRIRDLARPEVLDPWLKSIQDACAAHSVAAAIGTPTFDSDGRIFNSHVLIGPGGDLVGTVPKSGLTPSEQTFFAPGSTRPVFTLRDRRCTSVLCREVEDLQQVTAQLADERAELIFWPGLIGRGPASPAEVASEAHIDQARTLASRLHAHVVQANWPNSLNYPEEGSHAGQSVVIDPTGTILLQLPRAEPGVAVFELGQFQYAWFPDCA